MSYLYPKAIESIKRHRYAQIVITGSLEGVRPRQKLIDELWSNGIYTRDSMSNFVNYLIFGKTNHQTNKFKIAKRLGIPIIEWDQFQMYGFDAPRWEEEHCMCPACVTAKRDRA